MAVTGFISLPSHIKDEERLKVLKINKYSPALAMSGINFPKGLTEISVMPPVNFITLTVMSKMFNT